MKIIKTIPLHEVKNLDVLEFPQFSFVVSRGYLTIYKQEKI